MRKINLRNFQVATSLTARDINRRIVLNVVRTRQPVSRADVARLTGLQRSTVSLIADQLIEEGWVREGAVGHLPRGRRPIFLQLNAESSRIIGINVRPTTTTVALADLNGRFLAQETWLTPAAADLFVTQLCERVRSFIDQHPEQRFEGIGVSLPGRVDTVSHRLVVAPNLGWRDLDLGTPLREATGLPVMLENAANACALAEIYFAGTIESEGIDNLIAVTVSEGIGTGIIANGQLLRGPRGRAGEFGHTTIDAEGIPCRCGSRGCWEAYASNTAAIDYYLGRKAEVLSKTNGSVKSSKTSGRGHSEDESSRRTQAGSRIDFTALLDLAAGGDELALEAVSRMGHYLGVGLANLIFAFSPSRLVVVGEITRAWDQVWPVIAQTVEARVPSPLETRIVPSDDALQPRLRGTVAVVLEKHLGAPAVA